MSVQKALAPFAVMLGMSLAGCGSSPLLHVGNQIANMGQELPASMVKTNLAGIVGYDEDWVGRYPRVARNALYVQGVTADSPEYSLRVARVNINNPGSTLSVKPGELVFMTGAFVPDHLEPLKAGDVVEIRQTGTWYTMRDFVRTGEGNIVVRVICKKAQEDYDDCLASKAPSLGKFKGVGPTGSLYPDSARFYRFSFTPRYTAAGEDLPGAQPR